MSKIIIAEEMEPIPANVTNSNIAETYWSHFNDFLDSDYEEVKSLTNEILSSNKDKTKLLKIKKILESKYLPNHIANGNEMTEEWKLSELLYVLNRFLNFAK